MTHLRRRLRRRRILRLLRRISRMRLRLRLLMMRLVLRLLNFPRRPLNLGLIVFHPFMDRHRILPPRISNLRYLRL